HHRGYALLIKLVGVFQTGAKYRRWSTGIFRRAEYDDGRRRPDFVMPCLFNDPPAGGGEPTQQRCRNHRQYSQSNVSALATARRRIHHPSAKNSEISWPAMAPSRITVQRASWSVRSTIVEGISRGDVPPSTITEMRPWS